MIDTMKICMVNSFFPPWIGGAETYTSCLAEWLVKRGNDVTVYCAHDPLPPGESFVRGIRVRRMRAPLRLYGTPIAVSPMNLFLEDYDVIHCNFPSPYLAALFSVFSRVRNIPSVLTWHNDLPHVSLGAGLLVRAHDLGAAVYLDSFRRIIATTKAYAETSHILKRYKKRVVIVPNGVDTRRFNPDVNGDGVRQRHGLARERVALFVGALTQWHSYKGVDTLIEAFRTARKASPRLKLVIVGAGSSLPVYRRIVEGLDLSNDIIFAGRVADELLPQYYAACDFAVLPSKDRSEGFGLVLLEAMASGKPVIGSSVGGVVEVIKHRETGLLVEPNSPESLARAMIELCNDKERCVAFGRAGRKFAEKNDWSKVAERVENIYRSVLMAWNEGDGLIRR